MLLTAAAEGASAHADQAVDTAEAVESGAADRYHAAETKGFPKRST